MDRPHDRGRAFDTIYHEHHSYFSLTALAALFTRYDLRILDVGTVDIHGGSLHLTVSRGGRVNNTAAYLMLEATAGVQRDEFYAGFAARVNRTRVDLEGAMARFQTVVAYGAAAKGIVLLNAFGLDRQRVPWVCDVSPHKQGRFIPGTGQPIVPPERLLQDRPEAALLLPWNIRDEVLRRNQPYRDQGGRFIVPIPSVEIL